MLFFVCMFVILNDVLRSVLLFLADDVSKIFVTLSPFTLSILFKIFAEFLLFFASIFFILVCNKYVLKQDENLSLFSNFKNEMYSLFFTKNKKVSKKNKRDNLIFFSVFCVFVVSFLVFVFGIFSTKNINEYKSFTNTQLIQLIVIQVLSSLILAPVCEEIIYRGFMFDVLNKYGEKKLMVYLLIGLVFAFGHANIFNLIPTFLLSVFLTKIRYENGNILKCIGYHFVYNFILLIVNFAPAFM